MKTKLWMLGMAVAALTSCTQSEVVDLPENKAIGFNSFVENSTRAVTATTKDNLNKIWVIGYDKPNNDSYASLFDHVEVSKGNDNNWTYSGTKYWQKNTTYRFAAYANGNVDNATMKDQGVTYDPENDVLTFTNYIPNGNDLVASISGDKVVGENIPSDRVAFSFYHMLSRVRISFKLGTAYSTIAKISNIRIVKAITQGTGAYKYVANSPSIEWNNSVNSLGEYSLSTDEITLSTSFHELETFVIPQDASAIQLMFTFTTYEDANSTEYIHTYNKVADLKIPENLTIGSLWKNSYVYNYVCSFGEELDETPIEFTVYSVEGWNAANESAIILNPTNVTN